MRLLYCNHFQYTVRIKWDCVHRIHWTLDESKLSLFFQHSHHFINLHSWIQGLFQGSSFYFLRVFQVFCHWKRVNDSESVLYPISPSPLCSFETNQTMGKKNVILPVEPKDFELQRSCSFRGNDNGFAVWDVTDIYLCICAYSSSVSHCYRVFVFTLSYIPTRLFTNRNHGNMSVLICSPDSICHPQSSTASSLHLERKRDGNKRRRTWQWGFQLKMLHQSYRASCVIKNSKATVGDGMQMICSS